MQFYCFVRYVFFGIDEARAVCAANALVFSRGFLIYEEVRGDFSVPWRQNVITVPGMRLFTFMAFSVPWPLMGQTLYIGFDWIVILNKCGYGNLPIAIYSNLWFVLFLPSKHSSGKAAIFSMGSCAYNLYGRKKHKKCFRNHGINFESALQR